MTTASYAYNPSGLRSAKTVGGSTKYFVYNGMNIVYEYEDSISDGDIYYFGLNRTHNSEGEIYVYNAHGDVVQLVKNQAVEVTYTYDAFGNLISQIGRSDNPFLYCGEYFDAETSTYYLRARYYDPANGRFIQQDAWGYMDTSDPLSLNLYTYCCNNPVMYVDPSGNYGEAAIAWTSLMWWLIGADFALPIGDIIYVAGVVTCAIIDLVNIVHIENAAQAIDGMSQIIRENGQSIIDKTGSGNNESGSNSNSSPEPPNNNWNHRESI